MTGRKKFLPSRGAFVEDWFFQVAHMVRVETAVSRLSHSCKHAQCIINTNPSSAEWHVLVARHSRVGARPVQRSEVAVKRFRAIRDEHKHMVSIVLKDPREKKNDLPHQLCTIGSAGPKQKHLQRLFAHTSACFPSDIFGVCGPPIEWPWRPKVYCLARVP